MWERGQCASKQLSIEIAFAESGHRIFRYPLHDELGRAEAQTQGPTLVVWVARSKRVVDKTRHSMSGCVLALVPPRWGNI